MQSLKLLILLWATVVAAQSPVSVRDSTHNLTYVGFNFQGTDQFQGINYGQDTSGANRFKPPKVFSYPTGTTIQATAAGAACPQNTIQSFLGAISENPGVYNVSEDCLNLEVVRPAGTKSDANLPVMVWIYGQGFESGSYNYSLYNPTALVLGSAAKGTPVVYVAMNYRVNVFGFASSTALKSEGSLNAGLLDQKLALAWVQSNIAWFGGNPKNVTIFGESDGASSCGFHLTSNAGNGMGIHISTGANTDHLSQALSLSIEPFSSLVGQQEIQGLREILQQSTRQQSPSWQVVLTRMTH